MAEKQTPNYENAEHESQPSLDEVLQFERTIAALPEAGLRDIDGSSRIALTRYPEGSKLGMMEGELVHISLVQKSGEGYYEPYMNYGLFRQGDETSTYIKKMPPFQVPELEEILDKHFDNGGHTKDMNEDATEYTLDRIRQAAADVAIAESLGVNEITSSELEELQGLIIQLYG